ncbi:uncharacterized protein NECHADRAFT_83683 [Fusarium vanettenii 77-13-4]|uniref:Uncharacterized protein n=1 Tax=Fusarium vanettenii (strain ATCC MYA-4622 / CBS 123669 / FGSC 9596 / NRRL 45880 / 77-13-4) TaxID=660122 RepID=C7YYG6_FUSV7|nr:uncharacterized protein NECHADRAFT_83683 [Fusarium vanettenii 77-13-4]EEU43002.1 hypothetical protein NECHADRAFT_83683 [Fusarium vanettenii 77-13-4]
MPTLLHVLTRSNVNVDNSLVPRGGNSTVDTDVQAPESWRPWQGFDYATLTTIFRRELDKEYVGAAKPEPLPQDLCLFNEETLDDVLRRRDGVPHFGRGSRCGTTYKPDWSVISPLRLSQNQSFVNVLPGDTKLSKKWWPTMGREGGTRWAEWQKVITQIVTYMADNNSRYGFILSDECLVALRLTRKRSPDTLFTGRAPRATAGHVRYASDASMEDGSVYEDTNPLHWHYEDPEYVTVPWGAHGSNRLTTKLTLWFLAVMATNGDKFLDYSYPDLDSWRSTEDGYYIHNTSGAKKSRLSRGEQIQEPDLGQVTQNWDGTGENEEEWHRDEPSFSQISDDFGGGQLGNYGDEEEEEEGAEASGGEDDDDEAEDDEDGEEEEEGDSSRPQKKSIEVKIQKSRSGKGLYFLDAKNRKKKTTKKEWTKIEGGYMLPGKKHVYFAKKFP